MFPPTSHIASTPTDAGSDPVRQPVVRTVTGQLRGSRDRGTAWGVRAAAAARGARGTSTIIPGPHPGQTAAVLGGVPTDRSGPAPLPPAGDFFFKSEIIAQQKIGGTLKKEEAQKCRILSKIVKKMPPPPCFMPTR